MKTEEALAEFLVAHKLAEKGDGRDDWYVGAWFHTSMFDFQRHPTDSSRGSQELDVQRGRGPVRRSSRPAHG